MRISDAHFMRLVEEALRSLPPQYQRFLENVLIDVRPQPDARTCRDLGIDDPRDLLGLYEGAPLTEQSVESPPMLPPRIILYKRNLERICRTPAEITDEVRKTVLHEIGHHFGLSDPDLEDLGY